MRDHFGLENPLGGSDRSGLAKLTDGRLRSVLKSKNASDLGGMVSISVQCRPIGTLATGPNTNQRVIVYADWNNGRSGGEIQIDCQRGGVFALGAAEGVNVSAQIDCAQYGESLDPDAIQPMQVEVTLQSGAGVSARQPIMTTKRVQLLGEAPGPALLIPPFATSMIAVGYAADPAQLSTFLSNLTASFESTDQSGEEVRYQVPNAFANGCPIAQGAQYVRFNSTVAGQVFGLFELM